MDWDERVWEALKNSVTPMPTFVRKRALRKIIEASEESAKNKGTASVDAEDLVKAVKEKVPKSVQKYCYDALLEQGIEVNWK
jgi:hypothetical protein